MNTSFRNYFLHKHNNFIVLNQGVGRSVGVSKGNHNKISPQTAVSEEHSNTVLNCAIQHYTSLYHVHEVSPYGTSRHSINAEFWQARWPQQFC